MMSRYNPHALAREEREWGAKSISAGPKGRTLAEDIRERAVAAWSDRLVWRDPEGVSLPLEKSLAAEYGIDAARLAVITSGPGSPPIEILESSHRWLAAIHDTFLARAVLARPAAQLGTPDPPGEFAGSPAWNPDPWMVAAGTAFDHLLRRGRLYPALAAVRRAWKQSSPGAAAPPAGREPALLLLYPFAPVLSRWLLERDGRWPAALDGEPSAGMPSAGIPSAGMPGESVAGRCRPLEVLKNAFPGRAAIRLSLEGSGWQWVAVDQKRFGADPEATVASIPWVGEVVAGRSWRLAELPEGWKVCLNLPVPSVDRFRF